MPDIPEIHKLKAEIASCKQNNQEVVEFFSRLIGLWNELDNYIQIPPCKCSSAEKIVKTMEEDTIHQFLMGLDDERYSIVQSHILAMDPLPSIEKIFNMVQQEENHKSTMANREAQPETMGAFSTSHLTRPGYLQSEKPSCKHCGKIGHKEGNCYELVGYLAGWSSRGGYNRGRESRSGRANTGRGRGRETAHQAQVHGEYSTAGSSKDDSATMAATEFTAKQIQRILSLIETPQSTHEKLSGKEIWLLDSGLLSHDQCSFSNA